MPTRSIMGRIALWVIALGPLAALMYQNLDRDPHAGQFAAAVDLVDSWYVEDVEEDALFENAMRGLVSGLDPYSAYLSADSLETVQEGLDSQYAGVGMKVDKQTLDGPLIVLSPFFDTPAYHAGVEPGDMILAIDGLSTLGMPRSEGVSRIRGKPGDDVRLRLRRAGDQGELNVTITRSQIVVPSLIGDVRRPDRSWDFALQEEPRIAYLRLVSFSKRTVAELETVLAATDAAPFAAVILDLRNNPGGHFHTAVEVCDRFLDDGMIVTTRDRSGSVQEQFMATPSVGIPLNVPLAILVNRYSASSSEIVAACLQDHERAVVIGERTWGKGSIQKIFAFPQNGGALKLTTATYWRPSGQIIHRRQDSDESQSWGVTPNEGFEVSLSDDEQRQLAQQRRWRDVPPNEDSAATASIEPQSKPQSKPQSEPHDATPHDPSMTPGGDRVLQRAVEYLRARL